jgi:hypothetical protein
MPTLVFWFSIELILSSIVHLHNLVSMPSSSS